MKRVLLASTTAVVLFAGTALLRSQQPQPPVTPNNSHSQANPAQEPAQTPAQQTEPAPPITPPEQPAATQQQQAHPAKVAVPPAAAPAEASRAVEPVPSLAGEREFTLTSDVKLVLLDVSVKDKNGGYVSDLKKENFKILEDGKAQNISVFAAQDVPVTVGLIVDNSGSMRKKRPEVVTAALAFVRASNPLDEVFVVNFNDRVSLGLPPETPFSDSAAVLRLALLGNPAEGRTSLYDAIAMGLQHLDKGRRDKKTLLVISDGGDNASERSLDQIVDLLQHSPATVYTIGIYDDDDKDKNPGVLKRLAEMSGGAFLRPKKLEEISPVCEQVAKDIRNRYTMGYVPDETLPEGKFRKIQVVADAGDGRKFNIRTRAGYMPGVKMAKARK